MQTVLLTVLIVLAVAALALLGVLIAMCAKKRDGGASLQDVRAEGERILYSVSEKIEGMSKIVDKTNALVLQQVSETNGLILGQIKTVTESSEGQMRQLRESLENGLSEVRKTVNGELERVRADNEKQLDKMREVVDEKLTKTLNERLTQSFNAVNERLETVYKNLGEIQTLSSGMTDLNRVLSNIKTRGTFGEVSLENLLADSLTPSQYVKQCNLVGRGAGTERVDFAIIMPGKDDSQVYLPVDVKFPQEDYIRIKDAADRADENALRAATASFERAIVEEGRRIRDKYVKPPKTTDFAVMYLPTEGLYGEVLKNEDLMQNLYKMHVVPAGPTTFTALLNALRMGFQSLQVQKESVKVFQAFRDIQKLLLTFNKNLAGVKENLLRAERGLDTVSESSGKIANKLSRIEYPDEIGLNASQESDEEF